MPRSKQRSLLLGDGRDQDCPVALSGSQGRGGAAASLRMWGGRWGSIWALDASLTLSFVQSATCAPQHLQGWLGPQLLVSWAAAAEGEKHTSGPGGPGTGPRGAARQPTGLTAQPTHCRRSSAESSPTGVWEGVLSAVGQEPCGVNTCKRGQRGWPEAWGAAPWGRGQAVPPRSRHPCLGSPGLPPGPFMKRAPSFQGFNARGPCRLPLGGHRECSG